MPLDAAPMAFILWTRFLKHNPSNPGWFDRDRFILSAGHGSMLLYSLLYLTGYDLPLEQIKQFRQWESQTPGHPERGRTPGVEATTGPLGQGFGNSVGLALAEAHLAARYNRPGHTIVDHYTYAIASDGDLMEGVSAESASLAGHLKLGKLICLYDNNHVSLSSGTDLTFTEDVSQRFRAYGWHTQSIDNGNDLEAIDRALRLARQETQRPSLILVTTHLGYGSPNKQDTFEAHGSPLGVEEVKLTKERLGWPVESPFYIPDQALEFFRRAIDRGRQAETEWDQVFGRYAQAFPDLAKEFDQAMRRELPADWDKDIPQFAPDPKGVSTRRAVGKTMNAVAARLPSLMGGSADLDPSTYTNLEGQGDFESPALVAPDRQGTSGGDFNYAGRNVHFGVREHAMGSILNGMAIHGGLLPFGATFLVFSDYMRPPMRLAALMQAHVIYVFTHDSIGLGEDGPTHEPVEQLLGLRSVPNLLVIRPADANESAAAWRIAVEHRRGPVALALTRQNVPVLDLGQYPGLPAGVRNGGYVLAPAGGQAASGDSSQITLVATGSEVHLALAAREKLAAQGIQARVVSLPCWTLFVQQPAAYQESVIPTDVPILAIEAGTPLGWQPYIGPHVASIGVTHFGASAPGSTVMREYGFAVDNVCEQALALIKGSKPQGS